MDKQVRIINVNQGIGAVNDETAGVIRKKMKQDGTFMINLMASPGAGKTTLLIKTIEALKDTYRIGVMEADIEAVVDAARIARTGVSSIQVHTGGECAMDASMTHQAIMEFPTEELDLLVLENVGNLVCPAENDVGASRNVALLSIPEGDDKPLKYPLMFQVCDAVVITKTDTREYFQFDDSAVIRRIRNLNPRSEIFFLSAKTGEGLQAWLEWLEKEIRNWKKDPAK